MNTILISFGAGYIGSHTVKASTYSFLTAMINAKVKNI